MGTRKAFMALQAFPFSVNRNKFIGIGCDTLAVINAKNGKNYLAECLSLCNDIESSTNGSCFDIGCCQTSIPQNLLKRSSVPAVLDWSDGNQTCEEAKKNLTRYACQANTLCHDSDSGPGYLCRCSKGYVGNPYLPGGCQDVDECARPSLNESSTVSLNLPGSYKRSCPKGQRGDGRKGRNGCVPDRLNVVEIVIGIGTGLVALLIGSGWLYHVVRKRKLVRLTPRNFEENGGLMLQRQLSKIEGSSAETTKIFTALELQKATENFDESRIVGRGGYGTAYKGILPNDQVVAIKKSKLVDRSRIKLFINEVVVLSQINHRNAVKLLGCCLETELPLLVYEFVNNGTLLDHIHNENRTHATKIYWETRLRIATETAELLMGRKALSFDGPEEERNLAMYFLSALKRDCLFQILEGSVSKEGNGEQQREVADIAKWCLKLKGEERPTMKEVAMKLDGLRMMAKSPRINAQSNATDYVLGESSRLIDYADHCHYTCAENEPCSTI